MATLVYALKKFLADRPRDVSKRHRRRRNDPKFVGRSTEKEIEQASPERVGELVGHAPERVDT